jgi:hypothetical protein
MVLLASREVTALLDTRLPERFWDKVGVEPNSGCWLWLGHLCRKGYGRYKLRGKLNLAHRFAYEALAGAIPVGLQCDHLCRTRCCVNPEHLEPVTQAVNSARGRSHWRERTHCPHGHEYAPENTARTKKQRYCKECNRQWQRSYYLRKKGRR